MISVSSLICWGKLYGVGCGFAAATPFFGGFMNFFKFISYHYSKHRLNKILRSVDICSTFIGMPGTGKTTFCAYITKLALACKLPIYSNVPIAGAIPFTKEEFGQFDMSGSPDKHSIILLDEGSLFFDNRNFDKNFNQASLEYLKLLRHRYNHIFIFSQSMDIDIKFIRMSVKIFQLTKGFFRTTVITPVKRVVDVNDDSHKWEDYYYKPRGIFKLFTSWRIYRPLYYKYFDSYEAPKLPDLPLRSVYTVQPKESKINHKHVRSFSLVEQLQLLIKKLKRKKTS